MSERMTYEQQYPFFWLDETVETTLNPARNNLKNLPLPLLQNIREQLPAEISRVSTFIKSQAFCLYENEQLKVAAGHYDLAVQLLLRQAQQNLSHYPKSGPLRQTGQLILQGLQELARCVYSRYPGFLPQPATSNGDGQDKPGGLLEKVLCALSADQLGILLRAASDVGILVGRSFRKVCSAVAPYLSTSWKTDIAPDTLRSHAGRPEFRDKEIAIEFLQQMIEKIRGYR